MIMQNPFLAPYAYEVMIRAFIIFGIGLFAIALIYKFDMKKAFRKNIGKRYLSWLIIGPIYFLFILSGGYLSWAFLFLVMLLALMEFKRITKLSKYYFIPLVIFAIITIYTADKQPSLFYSLPILYFMTLTLAGIKENSPEKAFPQVTSSMYAAIWIIFSLAHFILLAVLNAELDSSKSLLLLIGFAVPLSDIFAYVIGKSFTKLKILNNFKIASKLSPNKTYVGSLGNMLGFGLGVIIMWFAIGNILNIWQWAVITILAGFMGVIGDITESMFKRYHKVKDSGNLIPGHGGILDRIDSTLRVIVVLYYLLIWLV
jgi:phosphatidate cytidylyltransferase